MPLCSEMVRQIPNISARSTYELMYPDMPIVWKSLAFKEEKSCATNIVSIGDSNCERMAVKTLMREGTFIKSLKLEEMPPIQLFKKQFALIIRFMDGLIYHPACMDILCGTLATAIESVDLAKI